MKEGSARRGHHHRFVRESKQCMEIYQKDTLAHDDGTVCGVQTSGC